MIILFNILIFLFKFNYIKKLDSTNVTIVSNDVTYDDNYIILNDNNC